MRMFFQREDEMELTDLIEKSTNKENFMNVLYTIVMDSIEYKEVPHLESKDATKDMLLEDPELNTPKTEDEILDSIHDNANDALVVMAEPVFQFIYELCVVYYEELKKQAESDAAESAAD